MANLQPTTHMTPPEPRTEAVGIWTAVVALIVLLGPLGLYFGLELGAAMWDMGLGQ